MTDLLTIDGSFGEGGGQILRTSLALSALTRRPFRMHSIRARRRKPGLAAQHATCIRALATICRAKVEGAELGSREVAFTPDTVTPGKYLFDIAAESSSAGATGLVLQTVLAPLLFAGEASQVTLRGGTHVQWAPHFHYLDWVFRPAVAAMGIRFSLELTRAGWYPRGEGQIVAEIQPLEECQPLTWEERPRKVDLVCHAFLSALPQHIASRETEAVQARLRSQGRQARLSAEELPAVGKGTLCFVHTVGETWAAGVTAFGELRKRAEVVGDQAGKAMLRHLRTKAAVDPHLADQLALYCALAPGRSTYTTSQVTLHLQTVLHVLRTFLPVEAAIEGELGKPGTVLFDGVGFRP